MTTKRAVELEETPNRWALRELPARVAVFLRAAGTHSPLRLALGAGGYGASDHAEGLRLLAAACPYREDGFDPSADVAAREAAARLASYAKRHFPRLRAALERLHPERADLVRESPLDDAGAVLGVAALLARLSELEGTEPRCAVLGTLAGRGLGLTQRSELAALVRTAQLAAQPMPPVTLADGDLTVDAALVELHRWFEDWSAAARAVIERRDWLIRLGLAERRRTRKQAMLGVQP